MTLGKCRLLLLYFRVVTIIPARITDVTLSRMTLVKCRLLQSDVTLTPTRIMDITLWRKCLAPAAMLCPGFCTLSLGRKSKSRKEPNIFGPYIPYGLFQTKGEMCAKFGSEMWICTRYKQTNKNEQNLYIYDNIFCS
jgi:hypothetical protein